MSADDVWGDLARKIAARRQQLGMRTQQDLADAAGISVATVTRMEKGRPMVRRSGAWPKLERALQWPPGYVDKWLAEATSRAGFLIEASELKEIDVRAAGAVRDALMATLPDTTAAQIIEAERRVIAALRDHGLLPPLG